MALLLALAERTLQVRRISCRSASSCARRMCINGLRGAEADGDAEFVRELCERLEVPLTIVRVDTAARQAAEGEGIEEAARELRYGALRGLMSSGAVDVVATAHTLDDQPRRS